MANRKNLEIIQYTKDKNVACMATKASNDGMYTVDSMVGTLHYFFDDKYVTLATPNGYIRLTIERAETIAEELAEIIPMVRDDIKNNRRPMDARSIGKMLEKDMEIYR